MSLIQLIVEVIQDKKATISLYIFNTFLLISFYALLIGTNEFLYPSILSAVLLFIYLSLEVLKYAKFSGEIKDGRSSPDFIHHFTSHKDELVFKTLTEIHREYNTKLYDNKIKQDTKNTLFSQWIHNMKTSVTVIELAS